MKDKRKIMNHLRVKGGVLIISYEVMRLDEDLMQDKLWFYCVLDEAQRIKNSKSQVYQAAQKLQTYNRLILSGTPM